VVWRLRQVAAGGRLDALEDFFPVLDEDLAADFEDEVLVPDLEAVGLEALEPDGALEEDLFAAAVLEAEDFGDAALDDVALADGALDDDVLAVEDLAVLEVALFLVEDVFLCS